MSSSGNPPLPPSPLLGDCPQSSQAEETVSGPDESAHSLGCFCCHRPAGQGCRMKLDYLDAALIELGMLASAPPAAAQYRTEAEQRALCAQFDDSVQLRDVHPSGPCTSTAGSGEGAGALDLGPGSLCLPAATDNPFRTLRHFPRQFPGGLTSWKKCDRWLRNESQIGKESTNLSFLNRRTPLSWRSKRVTTDRRSSPYPVIRCGSFGLDIRHGPSAQFARDGPAGSGSGVVINSCQENDAVGNAEVTHHIQSTTAGSTVTVSLARRATVVSYHPLHQPTYAGIDFNIFPNSAQTGLESSISFLRHFDPCVQDSGSVPVSAGDGGSSSALSESSMISDTARPGGTRTTCHLGPIRVCGRRAIRSKPVLQLCTAASAGITSIGLGHHQTPTRLLPSHLSPSDMTFLRIAQDEERRNCMALAIPWSFNLPAAVNGGFAGETSMLLGGAVGGDAKATQRVALPHRLGRVDPPLIEDMPGLPPDGEFVSVPENKLSKVEPTGSVSAMDV